MNKYIIKRLLLLIPVLIGVSLVVFVMLEITPGDPARQEALEEYYGIFVKTEDMSALLEEYNEKLVNRGQEVCVLDPKGEYRGLCQGITKTGGLLVELSDGTVTEVISGEVSVRGVYGYV